MELCNAMEGCNGGSWCRLVVEGCDEAWQWQLMTKGCDKVLQ